MTFSQPLLLLWIQSLACMQPLQAFSVGQTVDDYLLNFEGVALPILVGLVLIQEGHTIVCTDDGKQETGWLPLEALLHSVGPACQ